MQMMQSRPDRRADGASADSIRATLRRQFDAVYGPDAKGEEGGDAPNAASRFDEYVRCMRRHVLAEGGPGHHGELSRLLRTKRMKRLHNRFVLAILRDSMKAELPRRHVPEAWLPRVEGSAARPAPVDASDGPEDLLGLEEDDPSWLSSRLAFVRPPSRMPPAPPAEYLTATSSSVPGVLEVEPAMRREAAAAGLSGGVSPGAVRAMTDAAGGYAAALLGMLAEGRRAVAAGEREGGTGEGGTITTATNAAVRRDADALIAAWGLPAAYVRAAAPGAADPVHDVSCLVVECICAAGEGEMGGKRKRGVSEGAGTGGEIERPAKRARGEEGRRSGEPQQPRTQPMPLQDWLSDSERTPVTSNQSSGGFASRAGTPVRPAADVREAAANPKDPEPAGPGTDAAEILRKEPPAVERTQTKPPAVSVEKAQAGDTAEDASPGAGAGSEAAGAEPAEETEGFVDPFAEEEDGEEDKADGGDDGGAFVDPFEGDEPDGPPEGEGDEGEGDGPDAGGPPEGGLPVGVPPRTPSDQSEGDDDDHDALCGSHMQSPTQSGHFAGTPAPPSDVGGPTGGEGEAPPARPQFIPRGKILAAPPAPRALPDEEKEDPEREDAKGEDANTEDAPSPPAGDGGGDERPPPSGPPSGPRDPAEPPREEEKQEEKQQQAVPARGRGLKGKNLAAMRARKAAAGGGGDEQARKEDSSGNQGS